MGKYLRVLPKYSFWSAPFRWFRERKMYKALDAIMNAKYPEMEPEIRRMTRETIMYGSTVYKEKP